MVTRRGVRVHVPDRSRRRGDGGTGFDNCVDGHQPPDSSEDGAASHSMDGAGARRHVRMTASAAGAGVKSSRDKALIDSDALQLSEKFAN